MSLRISLQPGSLFHERFVIIKELGAGGMGSVYLAEQIDAGRKVALKIMHSAGDENFQENRSRFMREFKVLAALQHTNIVTFYSAAITAEGVQYAVCEYITGKSLQEVLLEEKRLSLSRVERIFSQICDALSFAHERGVIHRDLKPANIMLLEKPEPDTVKIIDFGLAKIATADLLQKLTRTGEIVGSPHYMSPEQIMGKSIDERSDLYSIACILFECLSSKKLFDDTNAISIIRKHMQEDHQKLIEREFRSKDAQLSNCLSKALSKEPESRQKSVGEFKEEFLEFCAAHSADKAQVLDLNQAKLKEQKSIIKFAAPVLFVLSVLLAGFYMFQSRNRSESDLAYSYRDKRVGSAESASSREKEMLQEVARLEQRLNREKNLERKRDLFDELRIKMKKLSSAQEKAGDYKGLIESRLNYLKYANISANPEIFRADLYEDIAKNQTDAGDLNGAKLTLEKAAACLDASSANSDLFRARWHLQMASLQIESHDFAAASSSFKEAVRYWQLGYGGGKTYNDELQEQSIMNDSYVQLLQKRKYFRNSIISDFDIARVLRLAEHLCEESKLKNEKEKKKLEYCKLLYQIAVFFKDNGCFKDERRMLRNLESNLSRLGSSDEKDELEKKELEKNVQVLMAEIPEQDYEENDEGDQDGWKRRRAARKIYQQRAGLQK